MVWIKGARAWSYVRRYQGTTNLMGIGTWYKPVSRLQVVSYRPHVSLHVGAVPRYLHMHIYARVLFRI